MKKPKLKSCVFFFIEKDANNKQNINDKKRKSYNNLLVENDFWITNELTNLKKIYTIVNYSMYFYVPERTIETKLVEYDETQLDLESGIPISKNDGTILFKFINTQLIYFETYLKTTRKQLVFRLITAFETILSSLLLLRDQHIVHNYVRMETLLYDEVKHNLLLSNFRFSLNMSHISDKGFIDYFKEFFSVFDPTYEEWPLEIHLVSYMITNKINSLSTYNIEYVINEVIKHSILNKFGKQLLNEFVSSSLKYFQKYVNRTLNKFIIDITKYAYTWDTFALSFLYLKLLINFRSMCANKENKFIILFMKLLVNNIHLNPEKRLSSNIILNSFRDFIGSLDMQTYFELIH